jgi:hypothetical protein
MPDDSLVPLEFKRITVIDTDDWEGAPEGTAQCECGKEFMYSVHYEENLRQVNGHLVFRCPRCYAMSDWQTLNVVKKKVEDYEQETRRSTKRKGLWSKRD